MLVTLLAYHILVPEGSLVQVQRPLRQSHQRGLSRNRVLEHFGFVLSNWILAHVEDRRALDGSSRVQGRFTDPWTVASSINPH